MLTAHRTETVIRSRHPELDDEALKAIGDHFTFGTR
jgi:hypothetical protein